MKSDYQATGSNSKAPFTLKLHRGDGMVLIAMNWRKDKPPRDFVGFAIEYKEPGGDRFWAIKNRIGFPGDRKTFSDPPIDSTRAPFQKFRWVHFPVNAGAKGEFLYRVTPLFMDGSGALSRGEPQEAAIALMRETIAGKLNVAYTRGFVSSQAFVHHYGKFGLLSTLIPDTADKGLSFKPSHPKAAEAYGWMGFEARQALLALLDEAIAAKAQVRIIAYDFNLPELLSRLVKLGSRLRIIIDDSKTSKDGKVTGHGAEDSAETRAEKRLRKSAGTANVLRQHMGNLQHHKSIAVSAKNFSKMVYGSTNFSWRGFYVQNNHAVIVESKKAVQDYFAAFEDYFAATKAKDFMATDWAKDWFDLGLTGVDAKVAFSPHSKGNGKLDEVAKDIGKAKSSLFFSLAFLGQTKKGPVGPAIGQAIKSKKVHALGIADKRVGAENLGLEVLSADNKRRTVNPEALTKNVPAPFSAEPTGLSGAAGNHRGTRMHHKFIVIDFDTDDARVYFGSYNFSEPADFENGENLLVIRDRTVATSYMVEALRIYDHYRYRTVQSAAGGKGPKILELKKPPQKASERPWWQRDWDDPIRARDRELFS